MIIKVSGMMSVMREQIRQAKRQYPKAQFELFRGDLIGGFYLYAPGYNERGVVIK